MLYQGYFSGNFRTALQILFKQLLGLVDKIDLDKSGIKKKLESEIERHKKFRSGIMGKADAEYEAEEADIRNYSKYLLTKGSMLKKRDLLTCPKTKLLLKEKTLLIHD